MRYKNSRSLFISLLFLFGLSLSLGSFANPYVRVLPNGLKVIVKEDHRAPTAVHMVWYRAGSMDETSGTTGVAHVLEHMMFKGTPRVLAGEFSRRVAAAGGQDNAFTNRDVTVYHQQIPKESLPEIMSLEADRMQHLTLSEKEFTQEIKVVMEERRMRTEDNPRARLFEQLNATALMAHPYRVPIIGWMRDIENMRVGDARDWYRRWYVPNNAFVVVVGDVDHEQVFKLAQKYYGGIASRALPVVKVPAEPVQMGERRITVRAEADLPMLVMSYKVPLLADYLADKEPYALQMLSALLDGYDGARLPQHLVRENPVAVSAGASYAFMARGPGLFSIVAAPVEGKSVSELEARIRGELRDIAENGVAEKELERVRSQLIAAQVYKRDSMYGAASELGSLEALGIPARAESILLARLATVSAAEVQQVAKKYFVDDGLTVGVLEPLATTHQNKGRTGVAGGEGVHGLR